MKKLRVCIAGLKSWGELDESNVVGSPELNFIANSIYIAPLKSDETEQLIKNGLKQSEGLYRNNFTNYEDLSAIHEITGGHPFQILIVCSEIAKSGELSYDKCLNRLLPVFSNWWKNLTDLQKKSKRETDGNLESLEQQGLFIPDQNVPGYYLANGLLWEKFIDQMIHQEQNEIQISAKYESRKEDSIRDQLNVLTSALNDKIDQINNYDEYRAVNDNVESTFNFKVSPFSGNLISKICLPTLNQMEFDTNFIDNIYQLTFEVTKGPVKYLNKNGHECYLKINKNKKRSMNMATIPEELRFCDIDPANGQLVYKEIDSESNRCPKVIYHINQLRNNSRHLPRNEASQLKTTSALEILLRYI